MNNKKLSFVCLYIPRTYRHFMEVSSELASMDSVTVVNQNETTIYFSVKQENSVVIDCEYHIVGMLISSSKVDVNNLQSISKKFYIELTSKWKALKDQLLKGDVQFGVALLNSDKQIVVSELFLLSSSDFVENIAGKHRYNYPFENSGAIDDQYIAELPLLIQRVHQAKTCFDLAKCLYPDMQNHQALAIEKEHDFILQYLQLLHEKAYISYQRQSLKSESTLNETIINLNKSIHFLTVIMLGLSFISVIVGIMAIIV